MKNKKRIKKNCKIYTTPTHVYLHTHPQTHTLDDLTYFDFDLGIKHVLSYVLQFNYLYMNGMKGSQSVIYWLDATFATATLTLRSLEFSTLTKIL
jgi:hypothetical protein